MSLRPEDIHEFLQRKQKESEDLTIAEEWAYLEELYSKKLWHQLTLKLETFIKHKDLNKDNGRIKLYNNFVRNFETKINPLSLVEIVAQLIDQFPNYEEALEFLKAIETKVKGNSQAIALSKILSGEIILYKQNDVVGTRKIIEELDKLLHDVDGITSVHGRYYLLASNFYRNQNNQAEYYRTALRYLGCIEISELPDQELKKHACDLSIAALIAEDVFNFGELLAHPILETLKDGQEWLIDFLYAFNSGNIRKYHELKPKWTVEKRLQPQKPLLREKISLLCIMEMAFKRPATRKQLTFREIAEETQIHRKDVELLVMKAMAKGLIKGTIDQVANIVLITWVQPRVLDKQQISFMIQRLDLWSASVLSMGTLVETKADDILTSY